MREQYKVQKEEMQRVNVENVEAIREVRQNAIQKKKDIEVSLAGRDQEAGQETVL